MKTPIAILILSFVITHCADLAQAMPSSLSWSLLPENLEDLPLDVEYDSADFWQEIWLRQIDKPQSPPRVFMEQSLGVRWMGMDPDSSGKPRRAILVYGGKYIIDIAEDKTRIGKLENDGERILWADGAKEDLVAFKKRRRRRRGSPQVNFGKITLPSLLGKSKDIPIWTLEGLNDFLEKLSSATEAKFGVEDYSLAARLYEPGVNSLKFKYLNCHEDQKEQIENIIAFEVEPKVTCWANQNPTQAVYLFSALLQKPILECKLSHGESCGKATLPIAESFFSTQPKISLDYDGCDDQLAPTILHEVLHLAGVHEGETMDGAIAQAESCSAIPASLNFEESGDEFYNDLQIETRMLLFRRVRDEAMEKWGWSEGDKAYVLGTICSQMSDKFCSRRYFQMATEFGNPTVNAIVLPEGGDVSFSSAAHFGLYDSITEDLPRMHELAKYLGKDPNGVLLRRLESGTHRMHEFYAARTALEQVKNNRGHCNAEVDERVACEDLALIAKSPWFKNPQ